MIELKNISKSFDGNITFAVKDLSFTVLDGETLVLLGSSGCGKTTTLKMMNRLIEPTSGDILMDGRPVKQQDPALLRRSIGYVFQGIGLFPHLTIQENVEIVPKMTGWTETDRNGRARELLDLVGLPFDDYSKRLPQDLSGGQKQRVGVARALAADPAYLFMDEPFGALDALTRDHLQMELLDLKAKLNKTIIFVTHDIFEALTLADRIAILHEGKLEQIDSKDVILKNPATSFVRDLFEKPARQLTAFKEML